MELLLCNVKVHDHRRTLITCHNTCHCIIYVGNSISKKCLTGEEGVNMNKYLTSEEGVNMNKYLTSEEGVNVHG